MVFQRETRGRDAARRVLGVGHKVMGEALRQARETSATVATLPGETLNRPLVVYRIRDRLTEEQRAVRSVTLAVEIDEGIPGSDAVLKDWEVLGRLNGLVGGRGFPRERFRSARGISPEWSGHLNAACLSCATRRRSWVCLFGFRRSRSLPSYGQLLQPAGKRKGKTRIPTMTARTEWIRRSASDPLLLAKLPLTAGGDCAGQGLTVPGHVPVLGRMRAKRYPSASPTRLIP